MYRFVFFACILLSQQALSQASFQEISSGNSLFSATSNRGVAIIDYDNDGDDDIYVCGGLASANRLYRNDGNFQFQEVAQVAGLDVKADSELSVWFDANNDGWLDVMISGYRKSLFFKNNGNGTFTESIAQTGLASTARAYGLLVGDLNGDQWLDVYSNNFSSDNELFLNFGAYQFRNQIVGSGATSKKNSMGGLLLDQDDDGDLDMYLVFDGDVNTFFRNKGNAQFDEISTTLGLNVKGDGMGIDFADFNRDGKYDFYVTNLYNNFLMLSKPDGTYANQAAQWKVDDYGMSWGTVSLDYDNDRFSDIYMVNDYGYSKYPNKLYKNQQGTTFTNATPAALESRKASYGAASGDFNRDGLIDIVVGNSAGGGLQIFQNTEPNAGHWLQLTLAGTASNKFAVGASVKVKVNGETLMDEVNVGSGYASQNSYTLHFGLGTFTQVDEVSIRWPNGTTETFTNVAADTRYLAIEKESFAPFQATSFQQVLSRASGLVTKTPPSPQDYNVQYHSTARKWNEVLINSIRSDFARPTVHARNFFHFSVAVYDAWAAYSTEATTFLLDQNINGFITPFSGVPTPTDVAAARDEAISYAAFRLLMHRFKNSPGAATSVPDMQLLFRQLGYDESYVSTDYAQGKPAALGNYIAQKIIEFGLQDGANESGGYANLFYQPINDVLRTDLPGSQNVIDCNRWQPLKLQVFIDQNGNVQGNTPPFLSPEWGNVVPFALKTADKKVKNRNGHDYIVYHDPGVPPQLDPVNSTGQSAEYKWGFSLVSIWASHLSPADGVKVDISPASLGNIALNDYPTTVAGYRNFYKLTAGGDIGKGYTINPKTGQPYAPQVVPRGDYTRVLAEFWADGPKSETPPGHWFTLLNYVSDHPLFEKKFQGMGAKMDNLEWDVKAYLTMGGALHDVAITAWGIKGYYDGIRPISAIRFMADKGQSSNPSQPRYHPAGIPLQPGLVEQVKEGDPLAGLDGQHVNKIKLYTWRGPSYIANPATDEAGVGWILAENWFPYQRPSFVTPPFAGYISGHSTYSSAGAEVLTQLTGDDYFPGGLGEFVAKKNEYLVFEEGPSVDVKLQWARYKDASDQSSLSRIWGGIHPPADDIPGRLIGKKIGNDAFQLAVKYFTNTITGIEQDKPAIQLYPNPVSKQNKLQIAHAVDYASLRIVDVTGRTLFQLPLTASTTEVDISQVPSGMHVAVIQSAQGTLTSRLIIHE
jgi:hypothetical protein